MLRFGFIRVRVGERRHFLVEPVCAARALDIGLELRIDVAQMRDVGQRIAELLLGQRTPAPVGEPRRLVDILVRELLDQIHIADRLPEAADHSGNLGVEEGLRDKLGLGIDDLDILAPRVEDLGHPLVGHQIIERLEIEPAGQRIDDILVLPRTGHLDQTQHRPEGLLPQELRVDRYERMPGQPGTGFGEFWIF